MFTSEQVRGRVSSTGVGGLGYTTPVQCRQNAGHSGGATFGALHVNPTISIEDTKAGALLHVGWGTTRASVPFTTM
jgi:hypothetical protein